MKASSSTNIYMECLGVRSISPPAYGAVPGLLPHTDRVVLGLQVGAGLRSAACPVVEGGDSAGGACEELQASSGGQQG